MSAAVIGAGWAGLAAAVTLAARGVPVAVFEASRQAGGRARRVMLNGLSLDNGQHILIGGCRRTLAMLAQVSVRADEYLMRIPLALHFADGFRLRAAPLPPPLDLILGLICARGAPLVQAAVALRFMAALVRDDFRVTPDRSAARLLDERGQRGAVRAHLWEPLCLAALNTPPERASAQVFANVLRDSLAGPRGASDLLLARSDLGRLFPDPASRYVEERGGRMALGRPVRAIAAERGDFFLDGSADRYRTVILACAPQHAPSLLAGFPALAATRAAIAAFRYEPIVTCYLQYPEAISLPAPMLGVLGETVHWVFDRGQLAGIPGLLSTVASAAHGAAALAKETLRERVHAELRAALGPLPEPRWFQAIAEKRATFSCAPGIVRPTTVTSVPGLFLAGDYVASDHPGTLEAAVASGVAAAEKALETL